MADVVRERLDQFIKDYYLSHDVREAVEYVYHIWVMTGLTTTQKDFDSKFPTWLSLGLFYTTDFLHDVDCLEKYFEISYDINIYTF